MDFGLSAGFAHVIEKEASFPRYFAEEVIGGMLDVPATAWMKPKRVEAEEARGRAKELAARWEPFDWTARVKAALQDSP